MNSIMTELGICFFPSCSQPGTNKCSGCKTTGAVFYCSLACQKADWPHHKLSCEGNKRKAGTTPDKADEDRSSNSGSLQQNVNVTQDAVITCSAPGCSQLGTNKCSGCRTSFYCCGACQKADWPHHKLSCEGRVRKAGTTSNEGKDDNSTNTTTNATTTTTTNDNSSSSSDLNATQDTLITCSADGCSQLGTNKCSGCRTSFYCCSACQKADWPQHKLSCEGRVRKTGTTPNEDKNDNSTNTNTNATTTTTTTTNDNSSSSSDLGVTQDPVITCSARGCSQPGTNKCGGCRTSFYCCSACQKADWPQHKLSCEGRVRKTGTTPNEGKQDDSSSSKNTATTASSSSSDLSVTQDPVIPCSAPGCSQPGTNKCSGCKNIFYCCAKCQKADWSHHKDTCEGQLRKVGSLHLDKAKGFLFEQNWPQALMCSNITLSKMNLLNDPPVEEIAEALGVKVNALNGLNLVEQDKETLECAKEWHTMLTTKFTSTHPSTLNAGFSVIER